TGVQTCALPIFELLAQPPQLSGALLELAFELAAQVDHAGGCLAQLGVLYLPYIFRKCARPRADLVCEMPDQTARSRGLSVLLRLPRRQATWAASSRAEDRPDHSAPTAFTTAAAALRKSWSPWRHRTASNLRRRHPSRLPSPCRAPSCY